MNAFPVASLVLLVGASCVRAENGISLREFLLEARDQFKEVTLGKKQAPFADVHEIAPPAKPLELKEWCYTGFRFTMPDPLTEQLSCQFGLCAPDDKYPKYGYALMEVGESSRIMYGRWRHGGPAFKEFHKHFPESESFTQMVFDPQYLKPGKPYIMWFGFPTREVPRIRFALTEMSKQGIERFGMLPAILPGSGYSPAFRTVFDREAKPPQQICKAVADCFRQSGIETALKLADEETADYIRCGGVFGLLFNRLWREAQTGQGRDHPEWAAALAVWLQQRSIDMGATLLAEKSVSNSVIYLTSLNRLGAARKALQPFEVGMQRRAADLDPFSYPDAGPALSSLPEVRKRVTPLQGSRPMADCDVGGFVTSVTEMPEYYVQVMRQIAEFEMLGGDWKRSLERMYWAEDWLNRKIDTVFEGRNAWLQIHLAIGSELRDLGLLELADAEFRTVIDKEWEDIYEGRTKADAKRERIEIRLALGEANEGMLKEITDLRQSVESKRTMMLATIRAFDITRAKCLAALKRFDEADELLGKLVASGDHRARVVRLRVRVEAGKLDGVEDDLLCGLTECRETGRKVEEAELYSLYADYLDASGRTDEAVVIRREAIRLFRGFDLFTRVPCELAKLSIQLRKCHDEPGGRAAADEAVRLAADDKRLPALLAGQIRSVLAQPCEPVEKAVQPKAALAGLQPLRAVACPLAGMPLRGRLTLVNPSAMTVVGDLVFAGPSLGVTWDHLAQRGLAVLGNAAGVPRIKSLAINPGGVACIELTGAPGFHTSDALVVTWKQLGHPDQSSCWTLDPADQQSSSAVVEAGEYRRNAFHYIPIYHHYQHSVAGSSRASLRVLASRPARIEAYDAGDRLVFVDVSGNGSLLDAGDSLHCDSDFDGVADLPLEQGEALIRLQVFPQEQIPVDGMEITIESLGDDGWHPVAKDRILP